LGENLNNVSDITCHITLPIRLFKEKEGPVYVF
jgi:hypothetical protein